MAFNFIVASHTPPCLVLELRDQFSEEEFNAHIDEFGKLIDQEGWRNQRVYLAVDTTRVRIRFHEAMLLMKVHVNRRGERGTAGDPLLFASFVGINEPSLRLASQFLAKASGLRPMLLLSTLDEAFDFFKTHYEAQLE